jgi:hypothetical protein
MEIVANPELLSAVWKRHIRKGLRSARLRDFYLAQDPVQFAAYDWGLPTFVDRLSQDLITASFTPEPAVIVRGAKATGLSRPLAVMSPRDALVYRTLVMRAEPDLKRDLRQWTGATLEDANRLAKLSAGARVTADSEDGGEHDDDILMEGATAERSSTRPIDEDEKEDQEQKRPITLSDTESYEDDWFKIWLQKQGIIANICDTCPYVVESDIANFFTSIDLEVVREHLHSHTSLEKEVVRLCISLIRRSLPHPGYADSPTMGIPQEGFDSSRAIAHSLLVGVDRFFDEEGRALLYSRFMDDFVIGADSVDTGHRLIARLQEALEPLGLYPNTAKTRVVATDVYLREAIADENAWLEGVEEQLSALEQGPLRLISPPDDLVAELANRFEEHRGLAIKPRRWDRVLRRYYAVLRRAGCGQFTNEALSDLRDLPDSVTQLLEYVRSFPLATSAVSELLAIAADTSDIYGDVPLLVLETIGSSPNSLSEADQSIIAGKAWGLVQDQIDQPGHLAGTLADRMVAAALPVVVKFGDDRLHQEVVDLVTGQCEPRSHARIQAAVLAAALGRPDRQLMAEALPGLPWNDVLALRYLDALLRGEEKAVGVALNLLRPAIRLMPNRHHIHARPLMLLPILRSVAPKKMSGLISSSLRQLERNPDRLRDRQAEALIRRAKPSPDDLA